MLRATGVPHGRRFAHDRRERHAPALRRHGRFTGRNRHPPAHLEPIAEGVRVNAPALGNRPYSLPGSDRTADVSRILRPPRRSSATVTGSSTTNAARLPAGVAETVTRSTPGSRPVRCSTKPLSSAAEEPSVGHTPTRPAVPRWAIKVPATGRHRRANRRLHSMINVASTLSKCDTPSETGVTRTRYDGRVPSQTSRPPASRVHPDTVMRNDSSITIAHRKTGARR